jgi:Trk-type K+ transport system membrane component
MSSKRVTSLFSPEKIVLLGYVLAISIGTLLLALPICHTGPIAFLDLFFTATSATCVTGLFTISINQFTIIGKAVLLVLIQLGGLGLITMTIIFLSLFMNFGLGTQHMAGKILEIESWKHIKKILITIALVTISSELLGTLLIFYVVRHDYSSGMAWFTSLFHSVSSFCSAGISLFEQGMIRYKHSSLIIITTMILMVIGELGFITWQEIGEWLHAKYHKRRYMFSLHSRLIFYASSVLLVCTSIIFWILEYQNVLANTPFLQTITNTLFYAVSFRSTGFILTSVGSFQLATILLIMCISFIGSAPGSTGSGIKITTFAIFLSSIKSAISGKKTVAIQGRTIPLSQVYRSVAIVSVGLGWVLLTTFCLLITERGFTFIELFFEAMNSFSSLGMSAGITKSLSSIGKIFIIVSMIIGRIGSFTLILALKLKKEKAVEFSYPEEQVMLG